jgi:lipoprotein-anchoring transpeptidase ErfK/SrfK
MRPSAVQHPYVLSPGSVRPTVAVPTRVASAIPYTASSAQTAALPSPEPVGPATTAAAQTAALAVEPAQTPVPRDWRKHLTSINEGGIVISINDRRLLYWGPGGTEFREFPVAVARSDELTRVGRTYVARKKVGPDWRPTPSMLARDPKLPKYIPPGPDNPLGEYALYLDWRYYAIHGTNNPKSIGTRATSGCFRLYPDDIAFLFPRVDTGTPVVVVPKL